MFRNLLIFTGSILLTISGLHAQDPQFTQFYASPLYLNPAFAGANACSRVSTNYRNQWPSIPGAFVSYVLSFDHDIPAISSGVGALFTTDRAGTGKLRSTSLNLLYSYELRITRKWSGRVGFQAAQTIRDINFFDLTFGDQLARGGVSTSVEVPQQEKVSFLDFSSGVLFYSQKYWLGFSSHHMNQPNQSLTAEESILPVKYSVHAGAKLPIRSGSKKSASQSISPAIQYKNQSKFDQVDVGLYYAYSPMVFGVWYRGIPLIKAYQPGYANNDAVAFLVGLDVNDLRLGYSYDLTISRLLNSTGGTHEISLSYQFCNYEALQKRKKRKRLLVPCAKF